MYCDIVLMGKSKDTEDFARGLGFGKVFFKEDFDSLGLVVSKNFSTDRNLVERKKVKILVNPHMNELRDSLHFRSSGLNQVLCSLCNKNSVAVGFSLKWLDNPKLLGRLKQNIMLCRKYKVKMKFFTFAEANYELRGREDLLAFLRSIGMTGREAKDALEF